MVEINIGHVVLEGIPSPTESVGLDDKLSQVRIEFDHEKASHKLILYGRDGYTDSIFEREGSKSTTEGVIEKIQYATYQGEGAGGGRFVFDKPLTLENVDDLVDDLGENFSEVNVVWRGYSNVRLEEYSSSRLPEGQLVTACLVLNNGFEANHRWAGNTHIVEVGAIGTFSGIVIERVLPDYRDSYGDCETMPLESRRDDLSEAAETVCQLVAGEIIRTTKKRVVIQIQDSGSYTNESFAKILKAYEGHVNQVNSVYFR